MIILYCSIFITIYIFHKLVISTHQSYLSILGDFYPFKIEIPLKNMKPVIPVIQFQNQMNLWNHLLILFFDNLFVMLSTFLKYSNISLEID